MGFYRGGGALKAPPYSMSIPEAPCCRVKEKSIIKYIYCRVSLYLLGLLYTFLAVFMVADIFMCAIDSITTATKKVKITNESGVMEVIFVFSTINVFSLSVCV